MKEKWNALMDSLEEREFTGLEFVLLILTAFLTGLVIGIFTSPKKNVMLGCHNGNNSANNSNNLDELFDRIEELEIEEELDDEECGYLED